MDNYILIIKDIADAIIKHTVFNIFKQKTEKIYFWCNNYAINMISLKFILVNNLFCNIAINQKKKKNIFFKLNAAVCYYIVDLV